MQLHPVPSFATEVAPTPLSLQGGPDEHGLRNYTSRQVRHVRAAVQLGDNGQLSFIEPEDRGAVTHIKEADPRSQITWHQTKLMRLTRVELIKHRGATVWLTCLSASGKSTIAAALEERVAREGQPAYLLDGDNLRHGLCGDLGFAADDRAENVRRVAGVERLFADAGIIAIASLISPVPPPGAGHPGSMPSPGSSSSRCSLTRPCPSASAATRRVSTRGRGRV